MTFITFNNKILFPQEMLDEGLVERLQVKAVEGIKEKIDHLQEQMLLSKLKKGKQICCVA